MSSLNQQRVVAVGNDISQDEMVNLITAQETDNDIGSNTTSINDNAINYISAEVLEAVGINLETSEVSEEQLNTLLSLANHTPITESSPIMPRTAIKRESSIPSLGQAESSENVTVSFTPEGHVVITDASQRRFYFTGEQLAANNIDINNLSEDAIHQIISMALSALRSDKNVEAKRRKMDVSLPLSGINQGKVVEHSVSPSTSGVQKLSSLDGTVSVIAEPRTSQVALIGEEVDVKKNGRLIPAKIRYCRGGEGYKVQFSDGHFEWVGSEQIQVRAGPSKSRSDHESYSGNLSDMGFSKNRNIGSSGIGRRAPPAIPGIKVTPQNGYEKGEPNFCCVVCDRKLYQKEVKYLTIRVPACDECTQLKMMVMDTVEEYREPLKKAAGTPPTNLSDEAHISEPVTDLPKVPEELLEAPPILHRLDSPVQNIDCDALKENESVNNF